MIWTNPQNVNELDLELWRFHEALRTEPLRSPPDMQEHLDKANAYYEQARSLADEAKRTEDLQFLERGGDKEELEKKRDDLIARANQKAREAVDEYNRYKDMQYERTHEKSRDM